MSISFRILLAASFIALSTSVQAASWTYENGGKTFGSPDAACKAAVEGSNAKHHHVEKAEGRDDLYYCYGQHKDGGNTFHSGNAAKEDAPASAEKEKSDSEAQDANTTSTSTDSMPWSKERITVIANRSKISVGMHATVTMKENVAPLDGLTRYAAFAQLSETDKRTAALGNGGIVSALPGVETKYETHKSSGYMLKPTESNPSIVEFVTWNVGEPMKDFNATHAEHQFYNFLTGNKEWLYNVQSIVIDVYGLDVCAMCDVDLKNLRAMVLARNPNATVTFPEPGK